MRSLASALATGALCLALARTGSPARPTGAPAAGASRTRPDIVLITVESLRPDALGCYAGGRKETPAIDALAARGVRFERAYASSPSTAPSAATILTGLYPIHHGLRHDGAAWLAPGAPTLALLLRRAGYRTGAVVGSFHLDSDRGLDRGFETYDDEIQPRPKMTVGRSRERRADDVVGRGLQFLDAAPKGRPIFLWLDLYDPHYDYDPPEPYRSRFQKEPYRGEVAEVDAAITELLGGLRSRGMAETTEIILAGTHGEGLGDHAETGHGIYLYETTIRVPLIMFAAGLGGVPWDAGGRTIETPVGLVDLAPTILERAGLKPPPRLDGRSLVPLLGGRAEEASRRLFIEAVQPLEAYGWSPLFAVVEGNRKVVVGRRVAAFDLKADPGETAPIEPAPDWASSLAGYGRPLLGSLDPSEALKSRIRRQARGLAVPWADRPTCQEKSIGPDPRDLVALNDPLFRAGIAFDQGMPGSAGSIVEKEVIPTDPANYAALGFEAYLALRNGSAEMLIEALAVMQCDYPYRAAPYHDWGHGLELKKEPTKAERAFRLFALIEPRNEEPYYDLAALYALEGRKDAAVASLKKSIELGATDFDFIRNDPQLQSIRSDPRFLRLVGSSPSPAAPKP